MRSLFLFTRDLRIDDNTALMQALEESDEVIACFIFNPKQYKDNPYYNPNCVGFMRGCIEKLAKKIPLTILNGDPIERLKWAHTKAPFTKLYLNADYTPFARKREERIRSFCQDNNIECVCTHDALLTYPGEVLKSDGKPYTVFTPFFNRARLIAVAKPQKNKMDNYAASLAQDYPELPEVKDIAISYDQAKYDDERDIPELDATTHLSTHLKFGTYSVREVYHTIKDKFGNHSLHRQLYWRDFFTHIAYHFPHVFGKCFREKYDALKWDDNEKDFLAWCEGKTGFPIVDAGMRELNATGYMHNRVRMITASFLIKDLHIDWRWGEKYFAQVLIDYDPAVNNGNWQWASSTGCDSVPYFRIFNPWRQQQRFDPDCNYIKKWVPELAHLSAKQIHSLEKTTLLGVDYPSPMVHHKEEAENAKLMYKVLM